MTALQIAIDSGDYANEFHLLPELRSLIPKRLDGSESCRRFLLRVVTRSIIDVCVYPEGNPSHDSARDWLMGKDDSAMPFRDLVLLLDLEWIECQVIAILKGNTAHKNKVMEMKRLIYRLGEDAVGSDASE